MPATGSLRASVTDLPPSSPAVTDTASLIFSALAGLHNLTANDAELLHRAAAGARFIQTLGTYSRLERDLFRIALAELSESDAYVVEAAACCAVDIAISRNPQAWRADADLQRRALWLAAVLRLAEALCVRGSLAPDGAYATWTGTELYLEFDGSALTEARLGCARSRAAALEALTERRVILAHSATRRAQRETAAVTTDGRETFSRELRGANRLATARAS
jgi:hypothetical protein